MRGVQVRRYGGPRSSRSWTCRLRAGPGRASCWVQVEAAGLGPWDLGTVGGRNGDFGFPFTPGYRGKVVLTLG